MSCCKKLYGGVFCWLVYNLSHNDVAPVASLPSSRKGLDPGQCEATPCRWWRPQAMGGHRWSVSACRGQSSLPLALAYKEIITVTKMASEHEWNSLCKEENRVEWYVENVGRGFRKKEFVGPDAAGLLLVEGALVFLVRHSRQPCDWIAVVQRNCLTHNVHGMSREFCCYRHGTLFHSGPWGGGGPSGHPWICQWRLPCTVIHKTIWSGSLMSKKTCEGNMFLNGYF